MLLFTTGRALWVCPAPSPDHDERLALPFTCRPQADRHLQLSRFVANTSLGLSVPLVLCFPAVFVAESTFREGVPLPTRAPCTGGFPEGSRGIPSAARCGRLRARLWCFLPMTGRYSHTSLDGPVRRHSPAIARVEKRSTSPPGFHQFSSERSKSCSQRLFKAVWWWHVSGSFHLGAGPRRAINSFPGPPPSEASTGCPPEHGPEGYRLLADLQPGSCAGRPFFPPPFFSGYRHRDLPSVGTDTSIFFFQEHLLECLISLSLTQQRHCLPPASQWRGCRLSPSNDPKELIPFFTEPNHVSFLPLLC